MKQIIKISITGVLAFALLLIPIKTQISPVISLNLVDVNNKILPHTTVTQKLDILWYIYNP